MATVDESGNGKAAAAEAAAPAPAPAAARGSSGRFSGAELALRALLFAATLAALVVLVTAEETEVIPFFVSLAPPRLAMGPRPAKFKDSPALICLLVALCVTCLYSLLTALSSLRLIKGSASTAKTIFLLLLLDFYAAVMASATGSAGGVAWIGLKGNSHTMWNKICDRYGKFCRHIGASVFLALVASILLLLLAASNACALYRRTR